MLPGDSWKFLDLVKEIPRSRKYNFSEIFDCCCLKKNQNAPRSSEHPPVRKEKCLHIKSCSDLYSVLSNIRAGPTDANAFRDHRLTTQKG